jgi:hypothetical protein
MPTEWDCHEALPVSPVKSLALSRGWTADQDVNVPSANHSYATDGL